MQIHNNSETGLSNMLPAKIGGSDFLPVDDSGYTIAFFIAHARTHMYPHALSSILIQGHNILRMDV